MHQMHADMQHQVHLNKYWHVLWSVIVQTAAV